MKRYISAFFGVMTLMLALFVIFELLGLSLFQETSELADRGLVFFAIASVALLTIDIFLPVPSSLLMLANGAYFGVGLIIVCSRTPLWCFPGLLDRPKGRTPARVRCLEGRDGNCRPAIS